MTNNDKSVNIDLNDILQSMSEQIAKQSQEIAVQNATIAALQRILSESNPEPDSKD